MPQGMNYTSAVKAMPNRLESTAPANPITNGVNRAATGGAQTATASSNRQYQSTQNPMMFSDRGIAYKKSSTTDLENPPQMTTKSAGGAGIINQSP